MNSATPPTPGIKERPLITRLEFGSQGANPRFVVTNLDLPAETLYDQLYCQRGEADPFDRIEWARKPQRGEPQGGEHNRIKETQLDLFGTDRARATAATIRVNLLKIGASVVRNTRPIRILFASHHSLRETFLVAARILAS